jgi:hypothetical protein
MFNSKCVLCGKPASSPPYCGACGGKMDEAASVGDVDKCTRLLVALRKLAELYAERTDCTQSMADNIPVCPLWVDDGVMPACKGGATNQETCSDAIEAWAMGETNE